MTICTVRNPQPGDGAAIGLAHVLAWQVGYAENLPAEFLDALDPVARGQRWEEFIAAGSPPQGDDPPSTMTVGLVDGRVSGFCCYGPYRPIGTEADEGSDGFCELWVLNVHPDAWGVGLAQLLMADALAGLARERPEPAAVLWVLEGNGRGRRFYEKTGWVPDGARKHDEFGDLPVTELRYAIDLAPFRS